MDFIKKIEGARKVDCSGLAPKSVDPSGTLLAIHFLLDGSAIGEHKSVDANQRFKLLSNSPLATGSLVRQIRDAAISSMAGNILKRMVSGTDASRFLDATENYVSPMKLDHWRASRPSAEKPKF